VDREEILERLGQQVFKALLVHLANLEDKEHLELLVLMETGVHPDQAAPKEDEDREDLQDPQDLRVSLDLQVPGVASVQQDPMDRGDPVETLDLRDLVDR
jgi:hypothetical protein